MVAIDTNGRPRQGRELARDVFLREAAAEKEFG